MRKIPTLFVRDSEDLRRVTREVHPQCGWVVDGEGTATRKYDGTCVRLDDAGVWWARREVRPGRAAPEGFVPVEHDDFTRRTVGWEPVGQSAFAKYHAQAVESLTDGVGGWAAGTYELVGPKINGNPEGRAGHELVSHASAEVLAGVPRDFDGLADYLAAFRGEGIVWHHPDGRMAKLKRRDFPRGA